MLIGTFLLQISKLVSDTKEKAKCDFQSLEQDEEVAAIIKEAKTKLKLEKKSKKEQKARSKDEEKFSASDSNDSSKEWGEEDRQEVDRIVEMYKEKARLKKERKKKREKGKGQQEVELSSSSLSSESDILTSESEKFSDDSD